MIQLIPTSNGWCWYVKDECGQEIDKGFSRTYIHAAATAEDAYWTKTKGNGNASQEEPREVG